MPEKMQKLHFELRRYREEDCREMTELFYQTVHEVNAKDYTAGQLTAWADKEPDTAAWNLSFLAHRTVIAATDSNIVGFGDMDENGYLDRLYVHKNYQRMHIASAICQELENSCTDEYGIKCFVTHASITAKPFFEQRGYSVIKEQQVERKGIMLINYVMKKIN